jgi:hypothetical protein
MSKRTRIGKRYVTRTKDGQFKTNVDVGRSLSADRRRKSKNTVKAGRGHQGDIKRAEGGCGCGANSSMGGETFAACGCGSNKMTETFEAKEEKIDCDECKKEIGTKEEIMEDMVEAHKVERNKTVEILCEDCYHEQPLGSLEEDYNAESFGAERLDDYFEDDEWTKHEGCGGNLIVEDVLYIECDKCGQGDYQAESFGAESFGTVYTGDGDDEGCSECERTIENGEQIFVDDEGSMMICSDCKRADRLDVEESELSMTLANMERELGIDSEDYENYGKYTNPIARLNAAISKIEREFEVNEEDFQYRGLKKDAESFGAESRFDTLANKVAKDYESKGYSDKEAMEIGKKVAYSQGVKKYGKAGMTRLSKAGRKKAMKKSADSYSLNAESGQVNNMQATQSWQNSEPYATLEGYNPVDSVIASPPLGRGATQDFGSEQGYNDKMDESMGMRHRGKHSQSMKDRRDEASAMDKRHSRRGRKYDDVMTMDAEYDSPYGPRQTTDFGMVGMGNDFAQNRAETFSAEGGSEFMTGARYGAGAVIGITGATLILGTVMNLFMRK